MLRNLKWLIGAACYSVVRPRLERQKCNVLNEYSVSWDSYAKYLDSCNSIDEWLEIKGLEDLPSFCLVSGDLRHQHFNVGDFNRRVLLETIRSRFPNVKSITEYGCGIGRNLLFLKRHLPHVELYGYELCSPGVEIARAAAAKWGLNVGYSQLDYVGGEEADYVFPESDVAFTMYSLEQLPDNNKQALENILRHSNYGSVHIEPVPENYPLTFRGIVGRIDHWKANYLRNFEGNISTLENVQIRREYLNTSHNPLMFPTLYVIRKT